MLRSLMLVPPMLLGMLAVPGGALAANQSVGMSNFTYKPGAVQVNQGDTITWRYDGPDTNHSITSEDGQPDTFDSDPGRNPSNADHLPGTTYARQFDVPGTIKYFCKVHPGMRGTITVVGPAGAPAPTPAPDATSPTLSDVKLVRKASGPSITLRLSEKARVAVRLQRGSTVRKVTRSAPAGRSAIRLPKDLRPGRYAITVVAKDASGNASKTRKLTYTAPRRSASARAAAADETPIAATANGNALSGGLSFAPPMITLRVGQAVRWTNTDVIAPHTVTEDHGLFDLVGNDINGTPVSPSGFGPGTSVELRPPAGTISYLCRVHPDGAMTGVLTVPVTAALTPPLAAPKTQARTKRGRARREARRRAFQRTLILTWAAEAPAAGQVFDVEQRRGTGPWTRLRSGTTESTAKVKAGTRGTVTAVRARLRRADDVKRATGWSPPVVVTA